MPKDVADVAPVRPKSTCEAPFGAIKVAIRSPANVCTMPAVMLTSTFDGAPESPATVNVTFLGVTDEHGVNEVPSGIEPKDAASALNVDAGSAGKAAGDTFASAVEVFNDAEYNKPNTAKLTTAIEYSRVLAESLFSFCRSKLFRAKRVNFTNPPL